MFAIASDLIVIRRRNAENFAKGGHALRKLVERTLAQGLHSEPNGLSLEFERRRSVEHEFFQLFLERHYFVQCHPAFEARFRAPATAVAM